MGTKRKRKKGRRDGERKKGRKEGDSAARRGWDIIVANDGEREG